MIADSNKLKNILDKFYFLYFYEKLNLHTETSNLISRLQINEDNFDIVKDLANDYFVYRNCKIINIQIQKNNQIIKPNR